MKEISSSICSLRGTKGHTCGGSGRKPAKALQSRPSLSLQGSVRLMRFLLRVVAVLHPCAREVSATKDLPQLPDACCVHASLRFFNEIMVSLYGIRLHVHLATFPNVCQILTSWHASCPAHSLNHLL